MFSHIIDADIKDIRFAVIGILCTMIIVPYGVMLGQIVPALFITFLYAFYGLLKDKEAYFYYPICLCYCIPGGALDGMDTFVSFKYIGYAAQLYIVMCCAWNFFKHKNIFTSAPIVLIVLYTLISIIYGDQIQNILIMLMGTQMAFIIGACGNTKIENYIRTYLLIFIFVAIYGILEYDFNLSPYQFAYLTMDSYKASWMINRCVGLMGNPLLLCNITLFCFTLLLSGSIVGVKVNYLILALTAYLSLAVVSRTVVFVVIILYLIYLYITKRALNPKIFIFTLFFLVVLYFIVINYFEHFITDLQYRFLNADNTHRQSSWGTTINVLSENPFGLGVKNFANSLQKYTAQGFRDGFGTLDDFMATQFCKFGILGFFYITYYLYYNFRITRMKVTNLYVSKINILLLSFFILIGFSFDIEAYFQLNVPYYILMGMLIRETFIKRQDILNYSN